MYFLFAPVSKTHYTFFLLSCPYALWIYFIFHFFKTKYLYHCCISFSDHDNLCQSVGWSCDIKTIFRSFCILYFLHFWQYYCKENYRIQCIYYPISLKSPLSFHNHLYFPEPRIYFGYN